MNKKLMLVGLIALFMLVLAACGGEKQNEASSTSSNNKETARAEVDNAGASETRTIEYLGKKYTVPQKVEKIVITGAMEAMEDAVVLDVHPVGAISIGGKFPEMFASVTG
ncbi:hypothetical protein J5TS2_24480 [Brevibacillus halotolerans]|nr:hypothetical protein J5TS2_24480 [Brevibacillus halotolerans]